ncbi:MAG: SurA N-terminal domain-containing protein [Oceanospirillaceae bacterium]|nr:SurA N-terminal domain-containing protein [Oceanospirillaceae bacterium]
MLQGIRDGSKSVFAKVLVGLIIFTFAFWGIETIVSLKFGSDAPASVNGEDISEFEIAQMVELQKRNLKAQFGGKIDESIFDEKMLRNAAVERLVEEKTMSLAVKDAGLYYSTSALDGLILNTPDFQEDGKFNAERFDLVLRSVGFTRNTYRAMLRNNILINQNRAAWQASAFETPLEMSRIAALDAEQRDVSYATVSLEEAKKEVVVSQADIAAYFDANKTQFMRPERVKLAYVELDKANLVADLKIEDADVSERYDAMVKDLSSKTEYRVAQILVASAGKTPEALNKQKDAVAAALAAGEDFAAVAAKFSDDDSSKHAGGDLGFANAEILGNEVAAAVSAMSAGEVAKAPVESRDGIHFVKLLDKRTPKLASLEELRGSIVEAIKSERADQLFAEKLDEFKDRAFTSPNSLEGAAEVAGAKIQQTDFIERNSSAGITQYPAVADAAFSDAVVADHENSDVLEIADGKVLVLRAVEFKEAEQKPLQEVEANIRTALTLQNAKVLVQQKADALLNAVKGGAAAQWKTVAKLTRSSDAAPAAVRNEVFKLPAAGSLEKVQLQNGDYAVVRLDAVAKVDTPVTDSLKTKVVSGKAYGEYQEYRSWQIANAEIKKK